MIHCIIGIDEVGRGPIAGPVTICVFISVSKTDLLKLFRNRKLKDSKKLSAIERVRIAKELAILKKLGKVDFVIVSKSAKQIDKIGISKCIQKSIEEGLEKIIQNYKIDAKKCEVALDGALKLSEAFVKKIEDIYKQKIKYSVHIKGDENIVEIACASIIAKVRRDSYMRSLSRKLLKEEGRQYGWEENAGYGTKDHYKMLKIYGLSEYHRLTFFG
jgi:ribonuclease HII